MEVNLFKGHKWKTILERFKAKFNGRNSVALKDRFRKIKKCKTMNKKFTFLAQKLQRELKL